MVNATPAPTSPTNFRLEIRLRDMMRPSSVGRHGRGRARAPRAKQPCEQEQNHCGKPGRQHPEAGPTLQGQASGAAEQPVVDVAGHLCADEHADAVGNQHEESLRLAANRGSRFLVHVDLTGHEKEIVAHPVEQDTDDDEPEDRGGRRDREEGVAQHPGTHAGHQHPLHAEPREEQRHEQHEDDLGHLAQRLRRRDLFDACIAQEDLGKVVVGRQRDAQQEGGGNEDIERAVAELRQSVEADDATQRNPLPRPWGGRMRQRETVEAEQQARPGSGVERQRGLFRHACHDAAQHEADEQSGYNPADRAEHPDQRKLLLLRLDVVERQAVGEAERRHIAQVVNQQEHDEQHGRAGGPGHGEHHHAAQQVEHAQHPLSREVAVRHEPQEERRDDGCNRVHRIGPVRQRLHAMMRHGMETLTHWPYTVNPIAAIVAPFFLGLVADRYFATERVLGMLHLLGGVVMFAVPRTTGAPVLFILLLLVYNLCYMPTLGLANSLAFHHIQSQEQQFPLIRVFGTVGWIVAGLFISLVLSGMMTAVPETTAWPLYTAGIASVVLGLFCFTLPHTPPRGAGQPVSLRSIAGLDALKQIGDRPFYVFIIASLLLCIPLAAYYNFTQLFLGAAGVQKIAATQTVGQISETFFMLIMPMLFLRLGVKKMLMMGMFAWTLRYALFALAAPAGIFWMILIGIMLHGPCYDFFFVTGQIYVDKKSTPAVRGQAQGFLVLVTYGVGMFIGAQIAGNVYDRFLAGASALTLPLWRSFWILPAAFAAAVLVFFAVSFRPQATTEQASTPVAR